MIFVEKNYIGKMHSLKGMSLLSDVGKMFPTKIESEIFFVGQISDNISCCLSPTFISATVHNIEYIGRELGKENRLDKKSRNFMFSGACGQFFCPLDF
jgi:hypothetical protein